MRITIIDERQEKTRWASKHWKLIDKNTHKEIKTGEQRTTHRGVPCQVVGHFYPRRPGSTGKVFVIFATDEHASYYPGVINAEFVEVRTSKWANRKCV